MRNTYPIAPTANMGGSCRTSPAPARTFPAKPRAKRPPRHTRMQPAGRSPPAMKGSDEVTAMPWSARTRTRPSSVQRGWHTQERAERERVGGGEHRGEDVGDQGLAGADLTAPHRHELLGRAVGDPMRCHLGHHVGGAPAGDAQDAADADRIGPRHAAWRYLGLAPPLVTTRAEVDEIVDIAEKAGRQVWTNWRRPSRPSIVLAWRGRSF